MIPSAISTARLATQSSRVRVARIATTRRPHDSLGNATAHNWRCLHFSAIRLNEGPSRPDSHQPAPKQDQRQSQFSNSNVDQPARHDEQNAEAQPHPPPKSNSAASSVGSGIGGFGGGFTTGSSAFDALITTVVGLSMGERHIQLTFRQRFVYSCPVSPLAFPPIICIFNKHR